MRHILLVAILAIAFGIPTLRADEPTRRAQEELRKRNLYFGNIDGQMNQELTEALKRYQTRKGFNASGELDEETADSLKIEIAASEKGAQQSWPDVPVLKSDAAREMAEPDQAALQSDDEREPSQAPSPSPPPPAESPATSEQSRANEITEFVRNYLRDGETNNIELQVGYYAFPVQYFDHGRAGRDFVTKDTRNYCKRWPQRSYGLIGPVKFVASAQANEAQVEFTIEFKVRNEKHAVTGKTRNFWTVRLDQENFKIIAINEQRLHD